jgi:hypothetical protein
MENGQDIRRSKRKIVQIKAEVICSGRSFKGYIENISPSGLYFLTTVSESSDYTCGKEVEIHFPDAEGNPLKLQCKVIWSYKTPPHGLTISSGLEVIGPPEEFLSFCKSLA